MNKYSTLSSFLSGVRILNAAGDSVSPDTLAPDEVGSDELDLAEKALVDAEADLAVNLEAVTMNNDAIKAMSDVQVAAVARAKAVVAVRDLREGKMRKVIQLTTADEALKGPKNIQTGPRGGRFYVGPSGQHIYVDENGNPVSGGGGAGAGGEKKGKSEAAPAAPARDPRLPPVGTKFKAPNIEGEIEATEGGFRWNGKEYTSIQAMSMSMFGKPSPLSSFGFGKSEPEDKKSDEQTDREQNLRSRIAIAIQSYEKEGKELPSDAYMRFVAEVKKLEATREISSARAKSIIDDMASQRTELSKRIDTYKRAEKKNRRESPVAKFAKANPPQVPSLEELKILVAENEAYGALNNLQRAIETLRTVRAEHPDEPALISEAMKLVDNADRKLDEVNAKVKKLKADTSGDQPKLFDVKDDVTRAARRTKRGSETKKSLGHRTFTLASIKQIG